MNKGWNSLLPGWRLDASGLLQVPCPAASQQSASTYLAGGCPHLATPKLAATVMLLRPQSGDEHSGEIETFLLRRTAKMAFAQGAVVFPGGGVDARDEEELPWSGPRPDEWAKRIGLPPRQAYSVVVAAIRELFEESGVLLAVTISGQRIVGSAAQGWSTERQALDSHQISLAEVLARHDLVLRTDLLGFRSRWLTPVFEPRRYDTFFFAARMPADQHACGDTSEAEESRWATPGEVLASAATGRVGLFPPTAFNLAELLSANAIDEFITEQPSPELHMFSPIQRQDGEIDLACRFHHIPGTLLNGPVTRKEHML